LHTVQTGIILSTLHASKYHIPTVNWRIYHKPNILLSLKVKEKLLNPQYNYPKYIISFGGK